MLQNKNIKNHLSTILTTHVILSYVYSFWLWNTGKQPSWSLSHHGSIYIDFSKKRGFFDGISLVSVKKKMPVCVFARLMYYMKVVSKMFSDMYWWSVCFPIDDEAIFSQNETILDLSPFIVNVGWIQFLR